MNIQDTWPTTPDEFLRWNQGREGKREFVHGRVVELMINVTERHYWLAARLQHQIVSQLGLEGFIVGSADFGIQTDSGVRYPDVMVHKPGNPSRLATAEPLLLAEILSPSTMRDDFGPKADEYLAIASLRHYLILSQDEARIWLWSRDEDGAFGKPATTDDISQPVTLGGLGIALDLAALYKGIVGLS